MKRCLLCHRLIWFWQKADRWRSNLIAGDASKHHRCTEIYQRGYDAAQPELLLMKSKDRAKERLIKEKYPSVDWESPGRLFCWDAEGGAWIENTGAVLIKTTTEILQEAEIDRLKQELATTRQQLVEAQASNANWRDQYEVLTNRIDTINKGRQNDVDSWRGKLAKANIELGDLRRYKHNREAFADAAESRKKYIKRQTDLQKGLVE